MAKLKWDQAGEKIYETGTKQGVLFVKQTKEEVKNSGVDPWYRPGVAWNGLTAVSESPSGAEESPLYADDIKYLSLRSNEEFGASVEAYTYPDEWAECDGSKELAPGILVGQQTRRGFAMAYVTTVGNDMEGNDYGQKLHLIYDAMASPSEKSYATINDSPEAITFSWELTTTPIDMTIVGENAPELKKSATIVIDKAKLSDDEKWNQICDIVFGTDTISYTTITPAEGANPSDLGYYVKNGDTYTVTEDTTVQNGTQYYLGSAGDSRMPRPQEIFDIITAE